MSSPRTTLIAGLTSAFLACATPSYDIDIVVRDGQMATYVCEAGQTCDLGNGFWWPKPGECFFTSDAIGRATEAACEPALALFFGGREQFTESLSPGHDYELSVQGCGHEPSLISLSIPPIELEIQSVEQRDNRDLTVGYTSTGANVATVRAGNWTSMHFCTYPSDGRIIVQNDNSYLDEAYLSVFAMSEHEGDFGVARVWVGTELALDL